MSGVEFSFSQRLRRYCVGGAKQGVSAFRVSGGMHRCQELMLSVCAQHVFGQAVFARLSVLISAGFLILRVRVAYAWENLRFGMEQGWFALACTRGGKGMLSALLVD